MSDVIDFLDRLGQDSELRRASGAGLDRALSEGNFSPEMRVALESGDRRSLEALLGASTNVCCIIWAPKPEEDEEPLPEPRKRA